MNAYQALSKHFEETLSKDADYVSCVEDLKRCSDYFKEFCEKFPILGSQASTLQNAAIHYGGWAQELDEIDDEIEYLSRQPVELHPEVPNNLKYLKDLKENLTNLRKSKEFSCDRVRSFAQLSKIASEEIAHIKTEVAFSVIKEHPEEVSEIKRCMKEGIEIEDKGKHGKMFENVIGERQKQNRERTEVRKEIV